MTTTIEYQKNLDLLTIELDNINWSSNEEAYDFEVVSITGADEDGNEIKFNRDVLSHDDNVNMSLIIADEVSV